MNADTFAARFVQRNIHRPALMTAAPCIPGERAQHQRQGDTDMSVTSPSDSRSERSGRLFARMLKALLRQEVRFTRLLVAQGMPPRLATGLLWLLKIALVVVVGFALFGLALILAIAFVAVRILGKGDLDPDPYALEWRQGLHGFGLYDWVGHRVDPYDPSEPTAND
jgi:hypothetical protein